MIKHLGIVMDPIASINPKKDSSFAMMLAAAAFATAVALGLALLCLIVVRFIFAQIILIKKCPHRTS